MENPLERIQTMLTVTPERWSSLCQTLPADLLSRRPAPSEWSAVECLQHLVDSEWAAHDLNHTIQAERALIQPYLFDCGPWIVYFSGFTSPSA
jgi:hypothetical protein